MIMNEHEHEHEYQGEHFHLMNAAITKPKRRISPQPSFGLLLLSTGLLFVATSVVVNFASIFLEPLPPFGFAATALGELGPERCAEGNRSVDVYIPGAGFAGYFYTLGRLEAARAYPPASSRHEYYCFSAGCLALVTSLLRVPVDSAIDLAHSSRNRWIAGDIGRYDVVEHFVDGLLEIAEENASNSTTSKYDLHDFNATPVMAEFETNGSSMHALQRNKLNLQDALPRINVITSGWSTHNFLSQNIQKPTSIDDLRRILVQTTWIPFVTGSSFGVWDRNTGMHQNDGAFAGLLQTFLPLQSRNGLHFPPRRRHRHSLLLPWRFDILSNGLNILLSHDKAKRFWREGFRRGFR